MISEYAETTPMIGCFISSSVMPQARSRERFGIRSGPAVMLSLLLTGISSFESSPVDCLIEKTGGRENPSARSG
jgi:hypothetical protein